MTETRQKIFIDLKDKLTLFDKKVDLIWCADMISMKALSLNNHQDNDLIFLNFGECLIFGDLNLKLSTSKLITEGSKFIEIGGALNNNNEAKELHKKFDGILGQADHYSESYDEIYTYWEDTNTKISIYPKHHMGGEWFEYKISHKNCT